MKKITLLVVLALVTKISLADEGMWIPSLIGKNYNEMQRLGLKLSAQDIYDINHASLKDAIVSLGGFCTAEIVSDQGLLLTNHHCAFSAIADQSTTGNNYLDDGFFASDKSKELKTGAYAAILQQIVDISDQVLPRISGLNEQQRRGTVKKITDSISNSYKKEKYQMVQVAEFFNGNQYFIFVYDKYTDVRLVGAPPASIGKFGGDTDNWMWPRHTGDFSVMRIYADANNKPAEYNAANVPFKPKKSLTLSLKGIKNGDYAMIMGFPGRTQRYEFSRGIQVLQDTDNPIHIEYWKMITETMKADMDKDPTVRLMLASRYAQLMNYYKYSIGQNLQLKRLQTVDKLKKKETDIARWIDADASRKEEYGSMMNEVNQAYDDFAKYEKFRSILRYGFFSPTAFSHGLAYYNLAYSTAKANPKMSADDLSKIMAPLKESVDEFYKEFNKPTEKSVVQKALAMFYNDIPAEMRPPVLNEVVDNPNVDEESQEYADMLFKKSIFLDAAKEKAFLEKPNMKALMEDPLMKFIDGFFGYYRDNVLPKSQAQQAAVAALKRKYQKAMLAMNPDKLYYPDANSTERLTYGSVKDYDGLDAIHYNYYTTTDGILEKMDNTNEEFMVPQKQQDLLRVKNYGRYADKSTGKLTVAFLTTNDITGGNSGSPVMNADGEQIGIAFDGNWEAMSGDIDFAGDQKRTICVDIRYVLWCIDKFAGAGHLINEMKLSE